MARKNNYVQEASRIELLQLKYFVAVAEHLNFSKAAEELYVSQPLLSQQISALEQILDSQLFVRSTKAVSLTPVGKVFLTEARRILTKTDEAVRASRRAADGDEHHRHFRVVCDEFFDRMALTDGAFRFMQDHPGDTCELRIGAYYFAAQMLEREEADLSIAFLEQEPARDRIDGRIIGKDSLDLVISRQLIDADRRTDILHAAARLPLLLPERDTRLLNMAMRVCGELEISPAVSFGQTAADVVMEVELGGAFTMLPHRFAQRYENRALVRLPLCGESGAQLVYGAYWLAKETNPLLLDLADYFADDVS